ncbi:MAG TPA: GDSL-type esterase/lipase family protein [Planktothrix sp.]
MNKFFAYLACALTVSLSFAPAPAQTPGAEAIEAPSANAAPTESDSTPTSSPTPGTSSGTTAATPAPELPPPPKDIVLTNPAVKEGLKLRVRNRKIVIGAGQLEIDGKAITIAQPTKVEVPPAGVLDLDDEIVRFQDAGKPADTVVLPHCRASNIDNTILRNILVPGTLKLKSQPGHDGPGLTPDIDYAVDLKFGALTRNAGGSIKPGEKVFADYQTWRRRLDTIAFDPTDNNFVLVQGIPARSGPEPPVVAPPLLPLANVYSDWGDGEIAQTDVMPISEKFEGNPYQIEHNLKAMQPIIKKLNTGDPIHLVFWGDSVTTGMDARSKQDGFVLSFCKQLKKQFPKANLVVSNLGIGGSTSSGRLPMLDIEVFGLKPDLIVVEFVNDLSLPAHEITKVYEELLDDAKKNNTAVILCTPHMAAPKMARTTDWNSVKDKPYLAVLRELGRNNDFVAVADVFARWDHLQKEGIRPEILLVNGLNHPNNYGHNIYVEELMKCFVATPDKVAQH